MFRPRTFLVLALLIALASLTLSWPGRLVPPAQAATPPALTNLPAMIVQTRLSSGTAGSTVAGAMPSIGVTVGSQPGMLATWAQYSSSTCPAQLWLVALSRSTGLPLFNDNNGTHGLVISPCDAANTAAQLARLKAAGNPIVIVNTLYISGCSSYVFSGLGDLLAQVGFGNTDGLDALDLCKNVLTGVGSPGLAAGNAYQRIQAVSTDIVAGASPSHYLPTTSSIGGALVANAVGTYHFENFDVAEAHRYGGDGVGGWSVAGVNYPFDPYPTGATLPPDGRGGFQILVMQTTATGALTKWINSTVWTNTGDPTTDAAGWRRLTTLFDDNAASPDRVILLRNVGSAKYSDTASADDPSNQFAWALDRSWGIYESISKLHQHMSLTIALHGGLPTSGTGWLTTPPPESLLPLTYMTYAQKGDPRYVSILLKPTRTGMYMQPARGATGSSDNDRPFAIQSILGSAATPWPSSATPGRAAAYSAWSQVLCACSDARQLFLNHGSSTWVVKLTTTAYTSNAAYTSADWEFVRSELTDERGWAENVWTMWVHMVNVQALATGTSPAALASVLAGVQSSFESNIDQQLATHGGSSIVNAIVEGVLVGFSDTPKISEAVTAVLALWTASLEIGEHGEAKDATFSGQASDLANAVSADAAEALTNLGVLFERIVSDRGMLSQVGMALANATSAAPYWYLPIGSEADEAKALLQSTTAGFYRVVLPLYYQEITTADGNSGDAKWWGHQTIYKWNAEQYSFFNYEDGKSQAWSSLPGNRQHIGTTFSYPEENTSQFIPGDWYLTAIALTNRMFVNDTSHPVPPSEALMNAIQASGVWLPVIFRQWPLLHIQCAGGQDLWQDANGNWSYKNSTSWSKPEVCDPNFTRDWLY